MSTWWICMERIDSTVSLTNPISPLSLGMANSRVTREGKVEEKQRACGNFSLSFLQTGPRVCPIVCFDPRHVTGGGHVTESILVRPMWILRWAE